MKTIENYWKLWKTIENYEATIKKLWTHEIYVGSIREAFFRSFPIAFFGVAGAAPLRMSPRRILDECCSRTLYRCHVDTITTVKMFMT